MQNDYFFRYSLPVIMYDFTSLSTLFLYRILLLNYYNSATLLISFLLN
jgi:hypothetical protein